MMLMIFIIVFSPILFLLIDYNCLKCKKHGHKLINYKTKIRETYIDGSCRDYFCEIPTCARFGCNFEDFPINKREVNFTSKKINMG